MRVNIPENITGKQLYSFLVKNKPTLIAQKKSIMKRTDPVHIQPSLYIYKDSKVVKAEADVVAEDTDTLRAKVVANTANWCDSHRDVLIRDCWAKSIKEKQGLVPHLHDHIHMLGAQVGDVVSFYSMDMSLRDLNVDKDGTTQVLVFETDIQKSYNEQVFKLYKAKKVKQHSIGLYYVKLELCINDADYKEEFAAWNKYVDFVINREYVDELGYFWAVTEIKLLENSAVLFGSNELTPTLTIDGKVATQDEPLEDTQDEPGNTRKSFSIKPKRS